MNILLKNGSIYDGTGSAPFVGDILIENDKIVQIGKELSDCSVSEVDNIIDIEGLCVAPGFIDGHSHNDWYAIKKEPLPYFEPFIRQGITTFVTGNCGLSATGFEKNSSYVEKLGGGLFGFQDTTGTYGSVEEFFEAIDGKIPCNIATLIGHCSARAGVIGLSDREMKKKEETQMLEVLEKGLQQGACGISLGLMYEPGLYADSHELEKVAKLCEKYDRPLAVHPRANSAVSMAYKELLGRSHLLRAVDELVEIAKGTKLKLHYSHAIFVGRRTFGDKDEFINIMHQLKREGVDAMFDIYNELMGVSTITVILPPWFQSMSERERKKPLNRLKLFVLTNATSKLLGFGFNDIEVAYIGEGYKHFEGKTVHQIAMELGKSSLDTYLTLCDLSNFKGRINLSPYSTPEIIEQLSKEDQCLYMTDAWVEEYGIQNPAIYDCYPKFLKHSILGKTDTMPRTIRKMTGGIADRFGIPDRGYLKPGYFADITVFDENKLKNGIADQSKAFGIEKVFINGKLVLDGEVLDVKELKTSGYAVRAR